MTVQTTLEQNLCKYQLYIPKNNPLNKNAVLSKRGRNHKMHIPIGLCQLEREVFQVFDITRRHKKHKEEKESEEPKQQGCAARFW